MSEAMSEKHEELIAKIEEIQDALVVARQEFESGDLKSVPYSNRREVMIKAGLVSIAELCGVDLEAIGIDANGEYQLRALDPEFPQAGYCGDFGQFAEILNPHKPRCGQMGTVAVLDADSGWCRLNHFGAEKLVSGFDPEMITVQSDETKAKGVKL